jgi:hypothetical protein
MFPSKRYSMSRVIMAVAKTAEYVRYCMLAEEVLTGEAVTGVFIPDGMMSDGA